VIRKFISLRHWVHVFQRVFRLIASPRVSLKDKLLFMVPVLLYWVLPDAMPYLPFDDIALTMLVANWFSERMEKKYPFVKNDGKNGDRSGTHPK
jgi:hypothetical protein